MLELVAASIVSNRIAANYLTVLERGRKSASTQFESALYPVFGVILQ
jgi:hypothetical protein